MDYAVMRGHKEASQVILDKIRRSMAKLGSVLRKSGETLGLSGEELEDHVEAMELKFLEQTLPRFMLESESGSDSAKSTPSTGGSASVRRRR